MNHLRFAIFLLLVSCGALLGGCSQGNSGDEAAAGSAAVPRGIDRFLLFPNPIVETSGNFQTNTNAFAQAYYSAVDPLGERNTLAAWKNKNQFGTAGQEFVAVFRDVRDLGYGRRMTGRRNADGTIAFFVENYNVSTVPGGYSSVNVDAARVRDAQWHVGTNGIEWSCDPQPTPCTRMFAKYYNFDPATGQRQNMLNLDGRGQKAMPGICINCHGGRGDPLTPQPSYALVANSVTQQRGDTLGKLQPFHVDSFEWSATPGFTRADQEATLKTFNQWVLCTYPGGGTVSGTWGSCTQPTADPNEWQATSAPMVEDWYGGSGMPSAQFSDTYIPAGWAGNTALYQQVVAPYCRTCHIMRGTLDEDDIDFMTEAKFQSYADRIKVHAFDRGNMPLAFLVYQDFWRSTAPATLAAYIDSVLGAGTATTASGAAKQPGRPIADPGPVRMVQAGTNAPLSGADSLFATSYSWAVTSSPPGGDAIITNASSSAASYFATVPGTYTVRLTVASGSQTDSKTVDITVDSSFPNPASIKFAHVLDVLRNNPHGGSQNCTTGGCHDVIGGAPPIVYAQNVDRDGVGGAGTATDEIWFLSELRGRANLTEIAASPLLRKPTGNHHAGNSPIDLTLVGAPGLAALTSFSKLYYWIVNGMPAGGVVANAGADSANQVSFTGGTPTASVTLDGSASIGATTYAWSVTSQPAAGNASIASAASATTTLSFQNVGTYVVQLQVSDGTDTDTDTRTITVTETPVVAVASPSGTVAVSFSGTPLTGTISLDSSGSTGNPLTYAWSYSPSGLSGACGTISNATSATATLTVPSSAVGNTCTFLLTASNVSTTDPGTTTITIDSAGSGIVANAGASGSVSRTFTNPSVTGGIPDSTGIPVAPTISLVGSASTGPGTLTYTWSVIAKPANATGSYLPTIASPSSVNTTLTVHRKGLYTVQLVVDNGLPPGPSNTATRDITVNVTAGNAFTNMKSTFVSRGCTSAGCHQSGSTIPPSWVDETVGVLTLYQRVTARVNGTDPASSLIVTCPSDGLCGMGQQTGFHDADVTSYTQFLNWIIDGAQNN